MYPVWGPTISDSWPGYLSHEVKNVERVNAVVLWITQKLVNWLDTKTSLFKVDNWGS